MHALSEQLCEGTDSGGEGANDRASVCNGEGENHAQPGGHTKKSGAKAAERQRETVAEGEKNQQRNVRVIRAKGVFSFIIFSGSGAPVHHPEQKGGGRSAGH